MRVTRYKYYIVSKGPGFVCIASRFQAGVGSPEAVRISPTPLKSNDNRHTLSPVMPVSHGATVRADTPPGSHAGMLRGDHQAGRNGQRDIITIKIKILLYYVEKKDNPHRRYSE